MTRPHPQIKKDGDTLVLMFRSRIGDDLTHSTVFPITRNGIDNLIHALSAIEAQPTGETFATDAEPIQHMVDEWLKNNKVTRKIKPELDPLVALARELCPKKDDPLVFLKDNRAALEAELVERSKFLETIDWEF